MLYPNSKHTDPLSLGRTYERTVTRQLARLYGIIVHVYENRRHQQLVGESQEGYEIKLDQHIPHTHRISIEVGEKARVRADPFVPSGILRDDNTLFYVQGFWDFCWLFHKSDLRQYYQQTHPIIISNDPPTIQKFYITLDLAHDLALHLFALTDPGVAWYCVCDYGQAPTPPWKNCRECPLFIEGHCNSKGGKELRVYLARKEPEVEPL